MSGRVFLLGYFDERVCIVFFFMSGMLVRKLMVIFM